MVWLEACPFTLPQPISNTRDFLVQNVKTKHVPVNVVEHPAEPTNTGCSTFLYGIMEDSTQSSVRCTRSIQCTPRIPGEHQSAPTTHLAN